MLLIITLEWGATGMTLGRCTLRLLSQDNALSTRCANGLSLRGFSDPFDFFQQYLPKRKPSIGFSDELKETNPLDVINEGLIPGMNEVSRLWDEGVYFLPQVVLSSDAMLAGIALCEEKMGKPMEKRGKVVTHTAEGDIHDIGQVIVNALLSAAGFEVINLGADVPVDQVVRACKIHRPIMVTGTALMTTTMTAFPRIAAQLEDLNLKRR
jgi:methanogenic corrinoid protein MtbC1